MTYDTYFLLVSLASEIFQLQQKSKPKGAHFLEKATFHYIIQKFLQLQETIFHYVMSTTESSFFTEILIEETNPLHQSGRGCSRVMKNTTLLLLLFWH